MENKTGFDFQIQDKLKQTCKENAFFLTSLHLSHDQMLETINYCSNGDSDLAFANLHRTRLLMEKCYWLNFDILIYGEASSFFFHFWRTCFIKNKYNLDCGGTYSMNFQILETVLETISVYERADNLELIPGFLANQTLNCSSQGSRINEEYIRDKK